jgi:hypothetical protein
MSTGGVAPRFDPFAQPSSGTAGVAPTSDLRTSDLSLTASTEASKGQSGSSRSAPSLAIARPGHGQKVSESA